AAPQTRGWRLPPHGAMADVVVGHAIARGTELQPVTCDAGSINQIAKRELGRARLKRPLRSRDLADVAEQDGFALDCAIGAHRSRELERLALVDDARDVERLDRD